MDQPSEPKVTCFDCGRAEYRPRLTAFPWWDERVAQFSTMYRCDRCLPRARKLVAGELRKDSAKLKEFVALIETQAPATGLRRGDSLADALRVLDELTAKRILL